MHYHFLISGEYCFFESVLVNEIYYLYNIVG